MNSRNVSIAGLAAVATVLAGCAAQYRNPSSCVDEMRSRLDGTSKGALTVTHRAVSYRGQRVVIEGRLDPASGAAAARPASAPDAGTPATALAASGSETAPAASASTLHRAAPASGASAPEAASKSATAAKPPQPQPATPIDALLAHFRHHTQKVTLAAAECTFDASGLTSFHWLAPPALAKTTPAAPARSE